ncbi:hypothetical protein HDV03_004144 [Kappamyces sp. JEL0829]|nr:hypothetical protein HDV03_004144 [Kappamyces sp. JEL0829]
MFRLTTIRHPLLATAARHQASGLRNAARSRFFFSSSWKASENQPSSSSSTVPPPKIKDETGFEKALREAKESQTTVSATPSVVAPAKKKSLVERIKEEALHYWHGTKLLWTETNISSRLLMKLLYGNQLTRREYRQLRRTTGDLLRLVPFIIILVVPFLEFALPVLLRFFPNMLPSTFESKFQEEEKKKNLLKVRIKMAQFLQETVGEVALSGTSKRDAAKEFNEFFSKCRVSGNPASNDDILRIARKLEDELTLNNLSRPQLVSIARFMNLNAFGTDSFLRSTIEGRLRELKADDRLIVRDGVDQLSISELQSACSARGIPTLGVSPARMKSELSQWLELHLVHKIPSSLLLLSRAFQTQTSSKIGSDALEGKAEALQATLSSLPHQVVNEAQLKISEEEGVATYKQKLDVLKEQEELIADELEQDAAQEALKKAKEEEESLKKEEMAAAESAAAATTTPHLEVSEDVPPQQEPPVAAEETVQPAGVSPTPQPAEVAKDKEVDLSPEEKKKLVEAIKTLSTNSALSDEKETLAELKEGRQEFIEDVEEFKQFTQKDTSKSSERLGSQVDKMISKIEAELAMYDSEIGSKLNLVKPNLEGQISIADLEEALKVIKDHPNDERISKIVTKLDADNDGLVAMQEIMALMDHGTNDGHGEVIKKDDKPSDETKQPPTPDEASAKSAVAAKQP